MKRVPIYDDVEWGQGSHPDAHRPLSAFRLITAACNYCGHVAVLNEITLSRLTAVPTFGALWRRAFCQACRDAGRPKNKANVMLHGTLQSDPESGVAWSKKPVFAEDRTDPWPALPPSPLMRCLES